MTVDDLGQLVEIDFSAELGHTTPTRWAASVLAVHRHACDSVRVAEPLPLPGSGPLPGAVSTPEPGRPLAPEQQATSARTDAMVARFEQFSATQAEGEFVGSADEVWLSFDRALGLRDARTTTAALGHGPQAMARAVVAAWQDARTQLDSAVDLERA